MHLTAKFYHPKFNPLEVIVLTNRRDWRHPPLDQGKNKFRHLLQHDMIQVEYIVSDIIKRRELMQVEYHNATHNCSEYVRNELGFVFQFAIMLPWLLIY